MVRNPAGPSRFLGLAALLVQPAPLLAQDARAIPQAPAPVWATPSEPLAVPDGVEGPLFLRRQDSFVRLTATGHELFSSQLIRILQPQALEIGNIAIAWNPSAGAARVHRVTIHRRGTPIDVLAKAGFEILRREDQLEAARLDGLLTAVLRVPDLRVGDDLEIEYSVPLHDPTLGAVSQGMLFMGPAPAPGRYRLDLSWDKGQEPRTRITPELAALAKRGADRITVALDNPPALTPPRDAPPRYAWSRVIEFSDFPDWQAVSRRFHGLFASAATLAPSSTLREEAAQIAAAHPGKLARAQAALQLVQQQVRYVYVGLDGGNFTPASAEETWERRYGDCKGKTAMLLALLAALDIPAEAVLVSNDDATDGIDQRLPNPGLFDHVLVRATIDGTSVWLDGTLPDVIEGRTEPFLAYRWVLPLSARGSALEKLAEHPFALPQVMELHDIDASAGFDAPARWTRTTVLRGAAGLQQHALLSSVSAGQLEEAFKSRLAGSDAWDSVDRVTYRFDRASQAAILTITGTGPVNWEKEGEEGRYLRLPGGGFSPPARRQRSGGTGAGAEAVPFWQAPEYTCHVTTVRLPGGTDADHWAFNTTYATILYGELFYRMMELRKEDRTLRLVRTNRVEEPEISPAKAERDNGRLARFDNSMAILSYSPGEVAEPWGLLTPVPAISEVDWTGRNPPCLPQDTAPGQE